jgi:D-alanine-D-alanine ligase
MKPLRIKQAGDFGKVGVLMGGSAAEREISLRSGTAVYQALLEQGVDAIPIDIKSNIIESLTSVRVDRFFNVIHGRGGEDGMLQAILEAYRVPYTGSGIMSSALAMDKLRTKFCWLGMGLSTPKWSQIKSEDDIDECIAELGFPVIIKPAMEGSSIGMSKANNRQELVQAFNLANQFSCAVFAEQWVTGHEYTVGVLAEEALPAIRLETPNAFYDFAAKYEANTTRYYCPAGLTSQQENQLQSLALQACSGIGIKGWARVDMFIDKNDHFQLIEVNTVPGMTDHSLVPMAAKAAGIEFGELVWRILETSIPE